MPTWLIEVGIALALTALEVGLQALAGGNNQYGPRVINRAFSTSTYGAEILRCRGTVRVPGNLIWSTLIQETVYYRQTSKKSGVTSYGYSCSLAVGFGRGPCQSLLALWTDGKRLYSASVSNSSVTGTVTLIAGTGLSGAQPVADQGAQLLTVTTGSNSTLNLPAGSIIQWTGDPNDYEVQQDVQLGPNSTGTIIIWPPLVTAKTADAPLIIPGSTGFTIDETDFTYDPQMGNPSQEGPRFQRIEGPTFYPGSTTQLPDPVMEEYLGVGNVPGYRNLIYMVLDQLQLANFGNHVPNFTAEIAFESPASQYPLTGPVLGVSIASLALPWETSTEGPPSPSPWVVGIDGTSAGNVTVINTATMLVQNTFSIGFNPACQFVVDTDGYMYAVDTTGLGLGVQNTLYKYDILSGAAAGSVNFTGFDGGFGGPTEVTVMTLYDWLDTYPTLSGQHVPVLRKFVGMTGLFGDTIVIERTNLTPVSTFTWHTGIFPANAAQGADGNGALWVAYPGGNILFSNQLSSAPDPLIFTIDDLSVTTTSVDVTAMQNAIGGINSIGYRYSDNSLVLVGGNGLGVYNLTTQGQSWAVETGDSSWGALRGPIDSSGTALIGNLRAVSSSGVFEPNTPASGVANTLYNINNWVSGAAMPGNMLWDYNTNSVYVTGGGLVYRIFLDRRSGTGVDIGDVITWLCLQNTDLDPSQIDTTAIAGLYELAGIQVGHETVHDSVARVMELFQIDSMESDGAIQFVPRDRLPFFVIDEDEIGALESMTKTEPRIEEALALETDIPERISIVYFDLARDYQQALQYSKRISVPYGASGVGYPYVTHTRLEKVLTVPISSDATTMKQQSEKLLYEAWASRFSYNFKVPYKFLILDPSDIGIVNYKGLQLEMRLVSIDRGAGFAMQLKAVSHDSQVYDSIAKGATGGMFDPIADQLGSPSDQVTGESTGGL